MASDYRDDPLYGILADTLFELFNYEVGETSNIIHDLELDTLDYVKLLLEMNERIYAAFPDAMGGSTPDFDDQWRRLVSDSGISSVLAAVREEYAIPPASGGD